MTHQDINAAHAIEPPALLSVQEHIRQIVLTRQGVSEHEASVLLRVMQRLERISDLFGAQAAHNAALVVKTIWLSNEACDEVSPSPDA